MSGGAGEGGRKRPNSLVAKKQVENVVLEQKCHFIWL